MPFPKSPPATVTVPETFTSDIVFNEDILPKKTPAADIRAFAATTAQKDLLGNGASKPLSGFYGTLAAAQAAYPEATALTDELDWVVITTAIQSFHDANLLGTVYLPHTSAAGTNQTIYMVNQPVVAYPGIAVIADGHAGVANGVTIKASASFVGRAVFQDNLWLTNINDWWHWGRLENFWIDCNNVAENGIAIHQMGEESLLRRMSVKNATGADYLLTGIHAPATLELCSAWTPGHSGFKFTTHPDIATLPLKTGSGGVVRLIGPSGDSSIAAGVRHVYLDGSQKASIIGMKSEQWATGLEWAGSSAGGGAGSLLLTGYFNGPAAADGIRISGTAQPIIISGAHFNGYTNWINDTVRAETLPSAGIYTYLPSLIVWNGSSVFGGGEVIFRNGIKGRRQDNAALVTLLDFDSSLAVNLRDRAGTTRLSLVGTGTGVVLKTQPTAAKTTTYTVTANDFFLTGDATSASFTFNLPTAVGIAGKEYVFMKTDASVNTVTLDGNGAETINGAATLVLNLQNQVRRIISDGANWRVIASVS